jgi:tRNA nucleotidyltransferase (CCA-adding enzyme)
VPKDFRQLALLVCEYHLHMHRMDELKASTILKLIESLDAFRNKERLTEFIHCCRADLRGRSGKEQDPYIQGDKLLRCFRAASSVDAAEIAARYANHPSPVGDRIKEAVRRARMSAVTNVLKRA